MQAAGVPRIMWYGLRHVSITTALAAGAPLNTAMKRAGHRSKSMTADRDGIHDQDAVQRAAEPLAKVLEG